MEEIEIVISPTGDVTVEGKGIAGPDCVKLTAGIEEALGERLKVTKKPEFHQARPLVRTKGA